CPSHRGSEASAPISARTSSRKARADEPGTWALAGKLRPIASERAATSRNASADPVRRPENIRSRIVREVERIGERIALKARNSLIIGRQECVAREVRRRQLARAARPDLRSRVEIGARLDGHAHAR